MRKIGQRKNWNSKTLRHGKNHHHRNIVWRIFACVEAFLIALNFSSLCGFLLVTLIRLFESHLFKIIRTDCLTHLLVKILSHGSGPFPIITPRINIALIFRLRFLLQLETRLRKVSPRKDGNATTLRHGRYIFIFLRTAFIFAEFYDTVRSFMIRFAARLTP